MDRDMMTLVMVIALGTVLGFVADSFRDARSEPCREAPAIEHPVYIPCAVPVWEELPKDGDDMNRRERLARKMMEDCGAMIHEAERAK